MFLSFMIFQKCRTALSDATTPINKHAYETVTLLARIRFFTASKIPPIAASAHQYAADTTKTSHSSDADETPL